MVGKGRARGINQIRGVRRRTGCAAGSAGRTPGRFARAGGVAAGIAGLFALTYGGYFALGQRRIRPHLPLPVAGAATEQLRRGELIRALSYNIGYCSYAADFSFFMDGGTGSRAPSRAAVRRNLAEITAQLRASAADLLLLQEVDSRATRSHRVDQVAHLRAEFVEMAAVFGLNYRSPYLLYPLREPYGANRSGLLSLSRFFVSGADRRSLPIESGPRRLIDLDRAFTVQYLPVGGAGADDCADDDFSAEPCLAVFNVHLSAYTRDDRVVAAQFTELFNAMEQEQQRGNWVLVGGDFNHELLGAGAMGNHTWNRPFPVERIPPGFRLVTAGLREAGVSSSRKLDAPYQPGVTQTALIDGFMVSDGVEVEALRVCDYGFAWADHQPVMLDFRLR